MTNSFHQVGISKCISPSCVDQEQKLPEQGYKNYFGSRSPGSKVKCDDHGRGHSRHFSKHDTTTLGDIQIRAKFYCPIKNEYFLDRHRPSFQAVLDYYRTGLLRRPDEIPLDVMINELKFYRLEESAIEDFLKSECILKPESNLLSATRAISDGFVASN